MKFFSNQKIDEIGIKSVRLQKLLIFFLICQLPALFSGHGIIPFILYGGVLFLGGYGSYKRRTGFLRSYYLIHIIFVILVLIGAAIGFTMFQSYKDTVCEQSTVDGDSKVYFIKQDDDDEQYDDEQEFGEVSVFCFDTMDSNNCTNNNTEVTFIGNCENGELKNFMKHGGYFEDRHHNKLRHKHHDKEDREDSDREDEDDDDDEGRHHKHHHKGARIAGAVFVFILGVIFITLKIYSLVLAFKIRKLIRASRKSDADLLESSLSGFEIPSAPVVGTQYIPLNVVPNNFYPQMVQPNATLNIQTSQDEALARKLQEEEN